MKKIIPLLILFGFIFIVLATNHEPPTLTNFQQFYGSVTGLPAGTFQVRAQIGTAQYQTPISSGQYGYSPTFKVYGTTGQEITFSIVNAQGAASEIGTAAYTNGAITPLDFQYTAIPSGISPPANETPAPITETQPAANATAGNATTSATQPTVCWECNDWGACSNGEQSRNCVQRNPCDVSGSNVFYAEPGEERSCPSSGNLSTSGGSSSCLMSWECGAWSLCRNNQQTRICFRADNCAILQAQGQVGNITSIPKPAEERSCQQETAVSSSQCSPGLKRCAGGQLQQCLADGSQWSTLQTCSTSCDPITLTCLTQQAAPPQPIQKPSSMWMYLLVGSIILVLVIVSISMALLNKKKYAPAKEYIEESRERGIADAQIKEKLVGEGWDEKAVGKLFR